MLELTDLPPDPKDPSYSIQIKQIIVVKETEKATQTTTQTMTLNQAEIHQLLAFLQEAAYID